MSMVFWRIYDDVANPFRELGEDSIAATSSSTAFVGGETEHPMPASSSSDLRYNMIDSNILLPNGDSPQGASSEILSSYQAHHLLPHWLFRLSGFAVQLPYRAWPQ